MNSYLVQVYKTYTQYGLRVLLLRSWNFFIFKIKRILSPKDNENIEKFKSLKGKYAGKRIFIIGNGPSLNMQPLYLLKDEYTMCFNRFPLMNERINWVGNFYTVVDDLVIKDMHDEINKEIVPSVNQAFFPDIHPSNVTIKGKLINNAENVLWFYADRSEFSDKMPACGINKTVVNAGVQIAAWMGFAEIYLIGVDMTFGDQKIKKANSRNWEASENDPNHFDPRYFSKGRKYHNPGVAEMLEKFEECRRFFDSRNISIYNAGYGGKLEAFPRVKFEEVLNISEEKQEQLFLNAIHQQRANIELKDFKPYNVSCADSDFVLSVDEGVKLIKNKVFTHIPFGPYKGNYYFLKRDIVLPKGK